ncbi:proteasome activator complex subunit 4B-like [Photinus pyralis]|uniref:proteasome activator complex subunit 4B-like n=1 Tax=Photinus pyralis TaxID=7054 RepID=UPI0012672432|nr:proteasome activator complex subunit 4B-like [Photinus pyralis]
MEEQKWKKLLSPDDLQLDWKPLYDLCVRLIEKSHSGLGMYKYSSSLEMVVEDLICVCRLYFPVEATQEILDEFRPHLYPYDNTQTGNTINYLGLLLPIVTPPEKKHLGYELWLGELMELWRVCPNAKVWENHLTCLLARLANYNHGRINWDPYIPIMFDRFKRAFHLPVSYQRRQLMRPFKIDATSMVNWIVCTLGGPSDVAFSHLEKFMQSLESYYHPANFGKWTPKIRELLRKLALYFVQRVHCERFKKITWDFKISPEFKLTDADIERFVNIMKPCLEQAMFSGLGTQEVAFAMQYLAALRPDLIVPVVLEKLYTSMDSLTEPHKLLSSMICTMSVARFMADGAKNNYPEGPTHIFPLLTSFLPGIDPNDIRKCLMTFNLISHFSNLAPLVNSSEANNYYDDLTEEEHIICEASAGLEDFVLQFFDRICAWVESNSLDFVRLEHSDNDNKSILESVSETALFSVINALLYQCSPEIFTAALRKVHSFATNRILELKVSGKLVAILCACFAKTNPKETLKLFVPDLCDTIERLLGDDEDISKEEQLNDELLYNLLLLSEVINFFKSAHNCDISSLDY